MQNHLQKVSHHQDVNTLKKHQTIIYISLFSIIIFLVCIFFYLKKKDTTEMSNIKKNQKPVDKNNISHSNENQTLTTKEVQKILSNKNQYINEENNIMTLVTSKIQNMSNTNSNSFKSFPINAQMLIVWISNSYLAKKTSKYSLKENWEVLDSNIMSLYTQSFRDAGSYHFKLKDLPSSYKNTFANYLISSEVLQNNLTRKYIVKTILTDMGKQRSGVEFQNAAKKII